MKTATIILAAALLISCAPKQTTFDDCMNSYDGKIEYDKAWASCSSQHDNTTSLNWGAP